MTYKTNTPPTGRDFYFSQGVDNDELEGNSIESPVSTPFEAAVRSAAASPPPSDNSPVSVNGDSGTYFGQLILPDFSNYNGGNTAVISNAATTITCGSQQSVVAGAFINTAASGVCVKADSINRTGVEITTISASGVDGIGFDVSGTCDDIFFTVESGTVSGLRGVMFNHTATSSTPVNYRVGVIEFFDTDQILMEYNPPNASDQALIDVGTAQNGNGAVNTEIFHVMAGRLAITAKILEGTCLLRVESGAQATFVASLGVGDIVIEAGGAAVIPALGTLVGDIVVKNGAQLDVFATSVIGSITVEAGGILNCEILSHPFGPVTNDGIINGRIDEKNYGTQAGAGALVISVSQGELGGEFSDNGRFELNTLNDNIDQLSIYVTRKKDSASTTDVRVLYSNANDAADVNNGDIYFTGTLVSSVKGEARIDLTPTATPVPSQARTFFQIQGMNTTKDVTMTGVNLTFTEKP